MENKSNKRLKPRRDISNGKVKKAEYQKKKDITDDVFLEPRSKPKKKLDKKTKKIILTACAALLSVFLIAVIVGLIFFFTAKPTIDSENPFDVHFMTMFGNREAYNYTNAHRGEREHNIGVIYTLEDFFGKGLLVGEGKPGETVRKNDTYNIMVVGKDRVGSNTDVIMIVNFNAKTQEINILQIPRDTYVEDPINKNSSKRINAIYAFAMNKNRKN